MGPIVVVHLITELDAGGAQTALWRLSAGTDRARFRPVVACLYNGLGAAAQAIRKLDVPVVDVEMQTKWRWDALARLYQLLRRERPAILHTWMFHANLVGRIVGRVAGVPIIITSRRNVEIGGANRERLKRYTSWLDDRVIAVCEQARQAECSRAGASPEKVITVYNGVDVAQFLLGTEHRSQVRREFCVPSDALLVGYVGRLHPQKGLPDLLHTVARLATRIPSLRLLMVGDGELRSQLERQCRDQGLAEIVTFAGLRTDVPRILSSLDLFVLPSLWEGMPNVVLEAMAAALPVVATAVGGTPEVVVDGETGILVPPGDAEAMAQAIELLLGDRTSRQRMGQAGRKRVEERFTVAQMIKRTEDLYEQILLEKGYGR